MLATAADVATRLGRDLTDLEQARVVGLLEEASDAVTGFLGCTPDPVPDEVARVVSRVAARALTAEDVPVGLTSEDKSAGVYQVRRGFSESATSGGVWLTKEDRRKLLRFSCVGRARAVRTW